METTRELLEWPTDDCVYLTLDFECDYGTAIQENTYDAVEQIDELIDLLERFEIPLTTFVQTELLEVKPTVVDELRNSDIEVAFHPHSHTHASREETSVKREITESADRFEDFFGYQPRGYRLPNGNVRPDDYAHLADRGYAFNASMFPTWRPNHFNNTTISDTPHYLPEFDMVELPFTVYSSWIPVPTALSYCQLLGRPYAELLTQSPPSVIVFNIHMHDLVQPPAFDDLPRFYRFVYSRDESGFGLLASILDQFKTHGFTFSTLDAAFDALDTKKP